MLKELSIKNFKAWKDTGKVRLAPITVFFGSNSAGKTSLLQFLLMLRQTAESPDRHRVLHPGDRNTPVELGTFRDLVFEHNLTNVVEFTLAWGLPKAITVQDPLAEETITGSRIDFSATIASDPKGAQQQVRRFEYLLSNGKSPLTVEMKPLESSGSPKYELLARNYKLVRNQGRPWKLPPPIRFYAFPDEVGAYYQNAGFTSDLALELEKQLKRLQYLGPLRVYPERSTSGRERFPNTSDGAASAPSRRCWRRLRDRSAPGTRERHSSSKLS